MTITPYIGIDDLKFEDSYETIKAKLEYDFEEDHLPFMDKNYPILFIEDLTLKIEFAEDGSAVRYFEFFNTGQELYLNDTNLMESYDDILSLVLDLDEAAEINEEGLTSKKLGIMAGRQLADSDYTNEVDSIVIGSKAYMEEAATEADDIINYFLGYNPFDDETKE
jgi:hypothetical protein